MSDHRLIKTILQKTKIFNNSKQTVMSQAELTHTLRKQLLIYKCLRYELISLPNVRLFASDVRAYLYWSVIPMCGSRHVDCFLSPQTPVARIIHPFWSVEINGRVFNLNVKLRQANKTNDTLTVMCKL